MAQPDARAELFSRVYNDRLLAHQFFFEHRHRDPMPDYQPALIDDFHSSEKHLVDLVFRGGGKSTIAEEAIVLRAEFREFRYGLIVGNTIDRACQRLHAIRYEFENNTLLEQVFGSAKGAIWSADQIMLSSGIMIQALGRGQSLRGVKHLDQRPDFLFGDDLEEHEDARTEKARDETWRWFQSDLLPALDPNYLARVAATPLDPDALPMRLERTGWKTRRIPIYHPDPVEPGKMVSSWPRRFPMTTAEAIEIGRGDDTRPIQGSRPISIEEMEDSAQRTGTMRQFRAERLCQAEAPEDKPFTTKMFATIVFPQTPAWQAVYSMIDPARTTNQSSALTGCAIWSWIGQKLVVWEAWQRALMPSDIIDVLFEINELYHPVILGVEEDGLNEFLMQPIRSEQVRRGVTLPVQALRAPKGKYDFIRALQVWFTAGEVQFAKPLPDLQNALLAFPSGKIDAPNALAYAPVMRGGAPIYHEFSGRHVAPGIEPSRQRQVFLAVGATRTMVAAAMMQFIDGHYRVFADWMIEGEPSDVLRQVVGEARLMVGGRMTLLAAPTHFDRYTSVGLTQAAAKLMMEVTQGVSPDKGRPAVRATLQMEVRGMPALMVSDAARWTLNGLAGGYRFAVSKQGVAEYAEEGRYRILMEAIESLVGLVEAGSTEAENDSRFNAVTHDGRPYRSMLGNRR